MSYTTPGLLQVFRANAAGKGVEVCPWAQKQGQDGLTLVHHPWEPTKVSRVGVSMARCFSGSPNLSGVKWQGPAGETRGSKGAGDKGNVISS